MPIARRWGSGIVRSVLILDFRIRQGVAPALVGFPTSRADETLERRHTESARDPIVLQNELV